MGSLSPMRTSATSSSMSSLLQGRGNGEPQQCPSSQERVTHLQLPRFLLARLKVQAAGYPSVRGIQDAHQLHKEAICSCVQYLVGTKLGSAL